MAFAWLGRIYGDIGELGLATENTRKAYQLRNRASDRERFWITASYELKVTGNLESAQQAGEVWFQTYPRDPEPHGLLAGLVYQPLGKYEKSLEHSRIGIAISPEFSPGYVNQIWSYVYLNRRDDAEDALRVAIEHKVEVEDVFLLRYLIAFLKQDVTEMDRAAALGKDKGGIQDWISQAEAFTLAYSGRLRQARNASRLATELAKRASHIEKAAIFEAGVAVQAALFGNDVEARRGAAAALALSKGRDVVFGAAFALAVAGDSSQAEALANDLETRFPEDTLVRLRYLPALRAALAMQRGDGQKAVELLQIAGPYDLGVPGSWFGFFGNLYTAYVRGQGYLALGQGAPAVAEFRKIVDHSGIVLIDPAGAVARLQLGRAHLLAGDRQKAKSAYEDFLTLWKAADQDVPILIKAKAEYAALQ